MAVYRAYLFPEASVGRDCLILDARESHHLVRVLRAAAGARIEVFDGLGSCYLGRIEVATVKGVRVAIESVEATPVPMPRIRLLQALPKTKAMDLILRMATEIGAAVIQPVFTDQGEHRQPKLEKWHLTMIEACKQCGLRHVPKLLEPLSLQDCLEAMNPPGGRSLRVVASLEAGSRPLLEVLNTASQCDEIIVAVGPAGDFSAAEYQLLRESRFNAVRLGANVLRSETAAAYLLSVVDQAMRTHLSSNPSKVISSC